MSDQPEPYLLDSDSRLKRMATVKHGDVVTQWLARDPFESVLKDFHEARKALSLLNVALTDKDPRVSLDVRKMLGPLGETVEQARATGSIILSVRTRNQKKGDTPDGSSV